MDTLTDKQMEIVEKTYEGCFNLYVRYADWNNTLEHMLGQFEQTMKESVYLDLDKVIGYNEELGFDPREYVVESMWEEYKQKITKEYYNRK